MADASEPKLLQNGVLSGCAFFQAHLCFVLCLLLSCKNETVFGYRNHHYW